MGKMYYLFVPISIMWLILAAAWQVNCEVILSRK